jgi:RNA polymerase sigma-70 factor (ECF subfamily)
MPAQGQTSIQLALRDPDVALMIRVRDDDPAAFEELVRRYQDRFADGDVSSGRQS